MAFKRIKKKDNAAGSGPPIHNAAVKAKSNQASVPATPAPQSRHSPPVLQTLDNSNCPTGKSKRSKQSHKRAKPLDDALPITKAPSATREPTTKPFVKAHSIRLPKVKRSVLEFNNHAVTLDYDVPALSNFNITKLCALPRPLTNLDVPMHVIKFKANDLFLGAAIFHATMLDDLLEHPVSHDFFSLPHNYQRAILEEVRLRLLKQFAFINELHFSEEVYSLDDFVAHKLAKKTLKTKVLSVHFKLGETDQHIYILSNKTTYDLFNNEIRRLPQRQNIVVPRDKIAYWVERYYGGINLTMAEFCDLECGIIFFVTRPQQNTFFKLRTPQGLWQGCLQSVDKVKLEGQLFMNNTSEKRDTRTVEISVDLGGKHISLEELETFAAGYIIDSGHTIDKSYPLMANNIKVGTCQLTDIEGNIGFQIMSIDQSLLKK